jgi:hypothetical protein
MVRRALLAAFFFCLTFQASALADQPDKDLKAWMLRQSDVITIEGRFLQHRQTPLLAEPLVSAGTFRLARPDRVRWMIENPEALVLELEGNQIRAGRPGQLRTLPSIDGAAGLREMTDLFLGGSSARLDQFDIVVGPVKDSFTLTPRTPDGRGDLVRMVMVLDGPEDALSEVTLESAAGDISKIRFMDVVVRREVSENRQ